MKKSKPVEDKPPVDPRPLVNSSMVKNLLGPSKGDNLTEVMLLMKLGLDYPAAKLASSMTPEGHPALRYRLETVANLAVSLIKEGNFQQAAKDAVALLDACKAELSGPAEKEASRILAERARQKANSSSMDFAALARYVTGITQDDKAQPLFRRFVKHCIRFEKAALAMGNQTIVTHDKKLFQEQYAQTPETADEELEENIIELCKAQLGGRRSVWSSWFAEWHTQEKSKLARTKGQLGGRGKKAAAKKSHLTA